MELRARIRPLARRAAFAAVLGAVLVPVATGTATADAAKRKKTRYPVVSSVSPMDVAIGETLVVRGKHFRRGRDKNTVVFKRDGARAVFVKAPLGTAKKLQLVVPGKLTEFFALRNGEPAPTRFRIRVLASRFSKKFTGDSKSPLVSAPRPPKGGPPPVPPADGDCDGDGQLNKVDGDDDNDGLDDATETSLGLDTCKGDTDGDGVADRFEFDCDHDGVLNRNEGDDDADLLTDDHETLLGTDPCSIDTDGDGVEDGYEHKSAVDLNDDEFQDPNGHLPFPGKRPYPNALFADGDIDYDGDVLTLREEQALWKLTYQVTMTDARTLNPLSYSDGEQYSRSRRIDDGGPDNGRRVPTLSRVNYSKQLTFLAWARGAGYRNVMLEDGWPWWDHARVRNPYGLLDRNRDDVESQSRLAGYRTSERWYFDLDNDGYLSDNERDEDADGLTNYDETHGRMNPLYWEGCYKLEKPFHVKYEGTSHVHNDSDGDGVLDGADDQDHDDIPNVMELSRIDASGLDDRDGGKGDCSPRENPPLPEDFWHPDAYGRVNPYNPCLPAVWSRTCPKHYNAETGAPFDGSPNWYSLQ